MENEVKDMAMLNDGLREKIAFLSQVRCHFENVGGHFRPPCFQPPTPSFVFV